ncbi:transposable element Tc3 transposase [Trichonephila clavipes]|nr:transposable element Tc3 transposase [Trichonephila clavipes]
MNDNARPHRTLAVEELLESEDITRMDWPAYSPDLNPIEHVWNALGRRIAARLHHPENTQKLKQMLIEEWALLPQEMLHQLVLKKCLRTGVRKTFVALQLGETVAEKVTIVELTEIIKENQYFKEDVEFVKELIQYTIEDRKRAEEDRKRMRVEEDRKKEAENRLREKELELELARLNIRVNSDNERKGEGCVQAGCVDEKCWNPNGEGA